MNVQNATRLARQWVAENAALIDGFAGAYVAGSAAWADPRAELAPSSDLDLMVVLDRAAPPRKPGKLAYHGVLLEVSYLGLDQLGEPEQVLAQAQFAGAFRRPNVLADSTGRLTRLQSAVAAGFADERWVLARCANARDRVRAGLQLINPAEPDHEQMLHWVFPTGVTTHILLTAGLWNPTVRKRYLLVRQLLAVYGLADRYDALLTLLGAADWTPARTRHHLARLSRLFDATVPVARTPFPFSSDITVAARPIAIGGSQELIDAGDHREAVFWLVVTFGRCLSILHADAPALRPDFEDAWRHLRADLGLPGPTAVMARAALVEGALDGIWDTARAIIAANPEIRR